MKDCHKPPETKKAEVGLVVGDLPWFGFGLGFGWGNCALRWMSVMDPFRKLGGSSAGWHLAG